MFYASYMLFYHPKEGRVPCQAATHRWRSLV